MITMAEWAATVLAHPVKLKFEGLDEYHETIQEAYANDPDQRHTWYSSIYEHTEGDLDRALENDPEKPSEDPDCLERYLYWLSRTVTLNEISAALHAKIETALDDDVDTTYETQRLMCLELEKHQPRGHYWRGEYVDSDLDDIDIGERMRDEQPEYLLKEHPIEKVFSHAYGYGFDMEKVVFMCPTCAREPQTMESIEDGSDHFYCGMCGAEHLVEADKRDLAVEANLKAFAETLGVELYPFVEPEIEKI